MPVQVGDPIPDVEVRVLDAEGTPQAVRSAELLGTGTVVLFAVPGAFTPGCSKVHLPGYVRNFDDLKAKGVDTVACIGVNDAWVMGAWGEAQGATGKIVMIGDGGGDFAEAMGLVMDGSAFGLGKRSRRYAAIVRDGVIISLDVEEGGGIDVSACEVQAAKV